MKIIEPSFKIMDQIDGMAMLKKIELAGRTCYKSEDLITDESAIAFVKKYPLGMGHETMLEHEKVTVKIICDRGVSHELVRHRLASYNQESTRYCNYAKDKFNNGLTFIRPCWFEYDHRTYMDVLRGKYKDTSFLQPGEALWLDHSLMTEKTYLQLLELGWTPQQARDVLSTSIKTEVVSTMDLREWRLFFRQRTAPAAHPQMRQIACPMLDDFKWRIPVVFDDIVYDKRA